MSSRVVIITGASRGIGHAIAKYLLEPPRSCRLVLVARTEPPLRRLEQEYSLQIKVVVGDVCDRSTSKLAAATAMQEWGRLDGLILNHGTMAQPATIADSSNLEEWGRTFEVNVISCVSFVQECLEELRKSSGRIIFTSSGAAVENYRTLGAYGTTKAAFNQIAKTLAVEEKAVTTIAIRPGAVDTDMMKFMVEANKDTLDPDLLEMWGKQRQDGTMVYPEQPAKVMGNLVMHAEKELSGEFLRWNSDDLQAYQ